jgi:hypothetical protein
VNLKNKVSTMIATAIMRQTPARDISRATTIIRGHEIAELNS